MSCPVCGSAFPRAWRSPAERVSWRSPCAAPTRRPRGLARAVDAMPAPINHAARGISAGAPFEYPGGRTVRSGSFIRRRFDDAVATVATAVRWVALERQARLDCAYLYVAGQLWTPVAVFLVGLLRWLRVPIVIELNELPWTLRASQTLLQRLSHPLAGMTGVVAISAEIAEWARREAKRRGEVIDVIEVPILVDVEEQSPGGPAGEYAHGAVAGDASDQRLVILGSVRAAMTMVWRHVPDCRLVIAGADPADPALLGVVPRNADGRVDSRVDLPGYVSRDDLQILYHIAWALLLPLTDDARTRARYPTKIGEYLASGRPVVTSEVGEIASLRRNGENAFVCPSGDAVSTADAHRVALEDADEAAHVGAEGLAWRKGSSTSPFTQRLCASWWNAVSTVPEERDEGPRVTNGLAKGGLNRPGFSWRVCCAIQTPEIVPWCR